MTEQNAETAPVADTAALADGVLEGNRRALAQAITLVESTRSDHRIAADDLLHRLIPHTGKSLFKSAGLRRCDYCRAWYFSIRGHQAG